MSSSIRQDESSRSSFGMGWCLVAVVVIVFLVILVLPAIQASPEAQRRNTCNNNLKQIGLGLQTYADINKYFPYDALWGQCAETDRTQGAFHIPWSVIVIPCMESTPLYNGINKRLPIWNQSQEYGTGGVRKVTLPAYVGYIQSLAVFADGHSTTIQQSIDFSVWASLNTRKGGEEIDGDY